MASLTWHTGTAYDLFASIHVLHRPQEFGLRRAWAAGVRARLPEPHRRTLERFAASLMLPFPWVATLPRQEAADALDALRAIPAEERLTQVFLAADTPPEAREVLLSVARRGTWNADDLRTLQRAFATLPKPPRKAALAERLNLWAEAAAFGEALLGALRAYLHVFFAEEEARLRPVLAEAVAQARQQAARLPLADLLLALTQGVRFPEAETMAHLTLAPSFWLSPLVVFRRLGESEGLLVFGARPAGASLVPGEGVPDALLHGLQALSDPTRLRILRYLAEGAHTPTELARRLRLRPPTVVHHLHVLRLAGLVYLTVEGRQRRYAARTEQLEALWAQLQAFAIPRHDISPPEE